MILDADRAQLLIVDVQERLAPAMHEGDAMIGRCEVLMKAAGIMDVPILVSEQYPKGLGPTVASLKALAEESAILGKVHFSCVNDPDLKGALSENERPQVVIGGIEAHVCVLQTALGLTEAGYEVAVAADAVTSRNPESVSLALARIEGSGVSVVNTEMVLFEWMHSAGTPEFKQVSALIK